MRKKTLSIILDGFIVMLVITIILLIVMIVKRGKVTVDEENPFLALRNSESTEDDYDEDADVPIGTSSQDAASSNSAQEQKEEPEEDDRIYAEVTGDTVNIRRGAGTDYERLGSASKGETFVLEAVLSNGWSRVEYKTGKGFISNDFLRFVRKKADGNVEVADSELPREE